MSSKKFLRVLHIIRFEKIIKYSHYRRPLIYFITQAAYDELNEFEGLDKNDNLPKGIRVTGESKQLQDDVVHQVIEEAAKSPPDYDESEKNNFVHTATNKQKCM